MDRLDILFDSARDACAAWLYLPVTDQAAAPIVVMAHGLSGTRRDRLGAFAERFAVEGAAALVFDHRGFGDSAGEPDRFEPAWQLEDWRAAEDSRWRNRVSASWLLGEPYRPADRAAGLHCPWLVCVAGADQVARPGPAIEAARRAPFGELCVYPDVDHFDIYDGPQHEAVVADELGFLRRHLL
jgi:pimeloyl-ACP methyl ester carboxylesterase